MEIWTYNGILKLRQDSIEVDYSCVALVCNETALLIGKWYICQQVCDTNTATVQKKIVLNGLPGISLSFAFIPMEPNGSIYLYRVPQQSVLKTPQLLTAASHKKTPKN